MKESSSLGGRCVLRLMRDSLRNRGTLLSLCRGQCARRAHVPCGPGQLPADRIALELHLDFSLWNFFADQIALELHVDFPPGDGFFRGGAPGFRSPARGAEVGHRGRLGGVGEWFDS